MKSLVTLFFCALRADEYKINDANPAEAEIENADAMLASVTDKVSAGVQTEIGMAIAQKKPVVIAHLAGHGLTYFNQVIVLAGQANEMTLPIETDPFFE